MMTSVDSAEKDPSYLDDRIVYDSIVYPDIGYIDSVKKVVNGKIKYEINVDSTMVRKDIYLTIPTLKNGTWKYWDEKGNLIREENYIIGVLEKKKKK
jgi:antitoxin component YwqK of YwqJK toxin-antitoxin module